MRYGLSEMVFIQKTELMKIKANGRLWIKLAEVEDNFSLLKSPRNFPNSFLRALFITVASFANMRPVLDSCFKDLATAIEGQGDLEAAARWRPCQNQAVRGTGPNLRDSTSRQTRSLTAKFQSCSKGFDQSMFEVMDLKDEVTMYPNTRSDVIRLGE